ncbi:MAG: glycosyltransferase family 2 protein [Actinobacteria bacterium]|nr:glycosyltransferase family 2 protein [Actinomycetota bacterium]
MDKTLSIVIPVYNEKENIEDLYNEISSVLSGMNIKSEIIFVDDGSRDDSLELLTDLFKKRENIKVISFRKNFGKASALMAGFKDTSGDIIITMDGDLQDDPSEIPRFLKEIEKGFDLISGWKFKRNDPLVKIIPSKIFNVVTSLFTNIKLHDFNCGFKAYRRDVVDDLNIYGELHRFIPVLVAQRGFMVGEIKINHRPRKHGKSKYGVGRFIKGFIDFITVLFITNFMQRPSHFFTTTGIIFASGGLGINAYITYLRISTGNIQNRFPLLMLGILLMTLGFQFIFTGLLAEMIARSYSKTEPDYSIKVRLSH